jgi:hypothetical protein
MENDKVNQLLAQISDYNTKLDQFRKDMQIELRRSFNDLTKELFIQFPRLKSFGFTAYTPYFNDGDECVYTAYVDYPIINGWDTSMDDEVDGGLHGENLVKLAEDKKYALIGEQPETQWIGGQMKPTGKMIPKYGYIRQEHDAEALLIVQSVKKFLRSFRSNFWKDIVGDHARVTITESGISVEEYEHD